VVKQFATYQIRNIPITNDKQRQQTTPQTHRPAFETQLNREWLAGCNKEAYNTTHGTNEWERDRDMERRAGCSEQWRSVQQKDPEMIHNATSPVV